MKFHHYIATLPKMEHPTNTTTSNYLKPNSNNNNSRTPNAKRISISIFVILLPFLYLSLLHVPPSNLLKDTTFWFLMSNSIIIVIVATDCRMFTSSDEPGADLYDAYVKHCRLRTASLGPDRPEAVNLKEIPEELKYIDQVAANESGYDNEKAKELRHDDRSNLSLKELGHDHVLDRHVDVSNQDSSQILNRLATANGVEINMSTKDTKFDRSRSEVAVKNRDVARKKLVRRSVTERRSCRVEQSEYWKMSDEELNKRVEEFIRNFNREIRLQA